MLKKEIRIDDIRIAYIEKHESSPITLFFVHGNSGSSRSWCSQYNDPVFEKYRLIIFDLPSHGDSSDAENLLPALSVITLAQLMHKAIEQLKNESVYFLAGFSLGTNIVAEMLGLGSNPSGIILISPCVLNNDFGLEKAFAPHLAASILFSEKPGVEEIRKFSKQNFVSSGNKYRDVFETDYQATRNGFRTALIQSGVKGIFSDEIQLLESSQIDVLILFGKEDGMLNINYLNNAPLHLWNDMIYKIEGQGHFVHMEAPGIVNPWIETYIEEQFKYISAESQP